MDTSITIEADDDEPYEGNVVVHGLTQGAEYTFTIINTFTIVDTDSAYEVETLDDDRPTHTVAELPETPTVHLFNVAEGNVRFQYQVFFTDLFDTANIRIGYNHYNINYANISNGNAEGNTYYSSLSTGGEYDFGRMLTVHYDFGTGKNPYDITLQNSVHNYITVFNPHQTENPTLMVTNDADGQVTLSWNVNAHGEFMDTPTIAITQNETDISPNSQEVALGRKTITGLTGGYTYDYVITKRYTDPYPRNFTHTTSHVMPTLPGAGSVTIIDSAENQVTVSFDYGTDGSVDGSPFTGTKSVTYTGPSSGTVTTNPQVLTLGAGTYTFTVSKVYDDPYDLTRTFTTSHVMPTLPIAGTVTEAIWTTGTTIRVTYSPGSDGSYGAVGTPFTLTKRYIDVWVDEAVTTVPAANVDVTSQSSPYDYDWNNPSLFLSGAVIRFKLREVYSTTHYDYTATSTDEYPADGAGLLISLLYLDSYQHDEQTVLEGDSTANVSLITLLLRKEYKLSISSVKFAFLAHVDNVEVISEGPLLGDLGGTITKSDVHNTDWYRNSRQPFAEYVKSARTYETDSANVGYNMNSLPIYYFVIKSKFDPSQTIAYPDYMVELHASQIASPIHPNITGGRILGGPSGIRNDRMPQNVPTITNITILDSSTIQINANLRYFGGQMWGDEIAAFEIYNARVTDIDGVSVGGYPILGGHYIGSNDISFNDIEPITGGGEYIITMWVRYADTMLRIPSVPYTHTMPTLSIVVEEQYWSESTSIRLGFEGLSQFTGTNWRSFTVDVSAITTDATSIPFQPTNISFNVFEFGDPNILYVNLYGWKNILYNFRIDYTITDPGEYNGIVVSGSTTLLNLPAVYPDITIDDITIDDYGDIIITISHNRNDLYSSPFTYQSVSIEVTTYYGGGSDITLWEEADESSIFPATFRKTLTTTEDTFRIYTTADSRTYKIIYKFAYLDQLGSYLQVQGDKTTYELKTRSFPYS